MPVSSVTEHGLDEFSQQLRRLGSKQSRYSIQKASRKAGRLVLQKARQIYDERISDHWRNSGRLRRTFKVVVNRGYTRVQYGEHLYAAHANLIEYGHDVISHGKVSGRAEGKRILRDALDRNLNTVTPVFIQELRRQITSRLHKERR